MKAPFLTILLFFIFTCQCYGQDHFPKNGLKEKNNNYTVFKNATIHITPEKTLQNGTLIIQKDKIIDVGNHVNIPKNSIIIDLENKHIYSSFIELYSSLGLQKKKRKPLPSHPQYKTTKTGPYYWNEAIHPEYNAVEHYQYKEKEVKEYLKKGFGTVLSHQKDGIARGTGTLVALKKNKNKCVLDNNAACFFSFQKGTSNQVYPTSLMGCIALLRQLYYDLEWTTDQKSINYEDLSIKAMNQSLLKPQIFIANDKLNILRAHQIAKEFNLKYIIKGSGDEYQRLNEIKQIDGSLIVPIKFPKPYNVEDPYDALNVTTEQLRHWKNAPYNLFLLEKHKIFFAITSEDLKAKDFFKNLNLAISKGLSKETAYRAISETPAKILGVYQQLGSIEKGKLASFIISSDELFGNSGYILENWVLGEKTIIKSSIKIDVRGTYNLNIQQNIRTLIVEGEKDSLKAKLNYNIISDSTDSNGNLVIDKVNGNPFKLTKKKSRSVDVKIEGSTIILSFELKEGRYRMAGNINFNSGSWDGNCQLPSGEWTKWSAIRKKKHSSTKKLNQFSIDSNSINIKYPITSYGLDSIPDQHPVLIKNATIWTSDERGVLLNHDLLIRNGIITHIGKILDVVDNQTVVIDAKGKHITAGLIDEHSHIAISRGVNEGSHAISAEVRIGDVINPDDINIYRQIAGGVTSSQLLHGSANPIGGQSAIIKLRWGASPEEMKFKDSSPFIKFALGENVKQSNWGSRNVTRFPQTRMGIEQLYYDVFIKAKEYGEKWTAYYNSKRKDKGLQDKPRKDLQLDAILEILDKKRFVTCHSYVQSEINMLMKVADSMGFTLNTFTHILEGYKVADKMKEHGAGGSSFSDWWAYKFEVKDAIPHNASILNAMGIITAINSDDAEMGRRLNQEAAKGIKYGGMTEEDALNMVTINPAKLLHIDHRVGSIKVGKDADIVIWSDHPLSIYSKVEKTYIDGRLYFDIFKNDLKKKALEKERVELISAMIKAKKEGNKVQNITPQKIYYHKCNLIKDDGN